MPSSFINSCRFNPTLGGTTDWTYSSAVTGYNSPALAGAVNALVYSYRAESNDLSQWEEGIGAYNSSTGVFARTTVLCNSSGTGTGAGQSGAGTKITFSTVPQVAIVALADDLLLFNAAMSLTAAQAAQARANLGVNYLPLSNGFLTVSGANIILNPLYGNVLTIGGINATIPDAGVTLAATGLTVGTLYYIYAVQTSGVVTSLEASTTVPVISTTTGSNGVKIKTGDATRRLVGMIRPITGPAFSDLPAQRFVRSWLNRDRLSIVGGTFTGSTTSTSYVEITTAARAEFLIWGDEILDLNQNGQTYNTGASLSTYSKIAIDGAVASIGAGGSPGTANGDVPMGLRYVGSPAEGYHYATVFGLTTGASTANWYGGAGGCNLTGTIK